MSRHYIILPAGAQVHEAGITRRIQSAAVICGYDRFPHQHFFCNVSESLNSDHIDEPIWASILDAHLDHVTSADGFDAKLASMGITLPQAYKDELVRDWSSEPKNREVWWEPGGTIVKVGA